MRKTTWMFFAGGLAMSGHAAADASYQETTQITGGQLVDMAKSVPFAQKKIAALMQPSSSLLMLHGNQLASVSTSSTQIIDLDRETLTHIDNDKKTYTVTTFAQMRQAMQEMPKKIAQAKTSAPSQAAAAPSSEDPASQIKVTFDVSVTDTGATKVVNGLMAQEYLLSVKAHITDPNAAPGDTGSMTYSDVTDIWTVPEPPQMKEIDAFYARYAAKMMQGVDLTALFQSLKPEIGASSRAPLFAAQPGMGQAFGEMTKKMAVELQKIKGVRVLEITRFGGEAMVVSPGVIPPAPAPQSHSNADLVGKAAGAAAAQTAKDAASAQVSKLGTFGAAFGHSVLGAFQHTAAPAASTAQPAAPSSAMLYETTSQKSNFSTESIPPSAFEVPAGFTQITMNLDGATSK